MAEAQKNLHPELSSSERRALFRQGIELFNRGEFFASHESWEEIWRSTRPEPRDLFQGLIQIAAGMHHFQDRNNHRAAKRVLAKGRQRIESFQPVSHGIAVAALVEVVKRWETWLEGASAPGPEPPRIVVLRPREVG